MYKKITCKSTFVQQRLLCSLHIKANKREIKDFRKLLSATSFTRKPLSEIASDELKDNFNKA